MANVLNRVTKEYLRSVHDPDYPVQDWIINPELSAVIGFASRYWVINGDTVTLMDQVARDTVDAAALQAQRDAEAEELDNVEAILRAFMLIVLDEFNGHAAFQNGILNGIRTATSLADLKAKAVAASDYPQRTAEDLIAAIRNRLGS